MGGNALAIKCVRANRDLYETVKADVMARLGSYLKLYPIHEAPEKSDFGDLDVLYIQEEPVDLA